MRLLEIKYSFDTLAVDTYSKEFVDIELDQPWYGDSESGFGMKLSQTLSRDQVKELVSALNAWLESKE